MAATEQVEEAGSAGYHRNHMNAIFKEGFSFSGYERDLLALNLGDGTFLDISGASGVDSISDGRGAVFADFDNDGDTDIFLTTVQRDAFHLFRNNVGTRNNFLRVDLVGTTSGRDAWGSVVRVTTDAGLQTKLKAGGSGFLSQHDPRLLFGLGRATEADVEVTWPGGRRQRVTGVPAGVAIRLTEGQDGYAVVEERRLQLVDPLSREQALLARLGLDADGRFPDVPVRDLNGETARLSSLLRSHPTTVVNLWATWCGPCALEMPELNARFEELTRAKTGLIGLSVDLDTAEAVEGYVEAGNIRYPIHTVEANAIQALYPDGETVVPLTLVLDRERRILEAHAGWSEKTRRALERLTR